jgi:hypothetical protein
MFFKAKLHKESKNGFKTINCRPYPVHTYFFKKTVFQEKQVVKKIGRCVWIFDFLNFYGNIYGYIKPFKKNELHDFDQLKYYQNVRNQSI